MSDKRASKESRGMYGFDSSGLEKAAIAAKYLDESPNAKNAFDLSIKKEETAQIEHKKHLRQLDIEGKRVTEEEKRKTLQKEMEISKEKAEYEDTLAKKRIEYRLARESQLNQDNLRKQEESIKRQEDLKKATILYEHEMKIKQEREMLFNRYNIKAEVERKNLDLVKEKISLKEKERRTTNTELAKISFSMIGQGLKEFIYDKTMIYRVIMGLTGAYVVGIGCKSFFALMSKYLSAKFMTPKLIRETSRIPINRFYEIPINQFSKFKQSYNKANTEKDIFKGIILKPELEDQLKIISKSIINRKKHFTPFRNLLLYGPPGTGKTLFAKQLAKKSGLDFAILTGADVAPLGNVSVTEIHKLFDWAESSSNGLLIFVDEADAFLRRRANDELISENLRNSINAFLYRTGCPSTKYMVVLATNAPQLLDEAIQDRMDEVLSFDSPLLEERVKIIKYHLNLYLNRLSDKWEKIKFILKHPKFIFYNIKTVDMTELTDDYLIEISKKIEGFSGREIGKLVVSWHDEMYAKDSTKLDRDIVERVLDRHIEQVKTMNEWNERQKEFFKIIHKGEQIFSNKFQSDSSKERCENKQNFKKDNINIVDNQIKF